MSRRWLSVRGVSGFAREAAQEGEPAGSPVVGHCALRLQRAGGWRGEGGQRRGWRHRLEVGPEMAIAALGAGLLAALSTRLLVALSAGLPVLSDAWRGAGHRALPRGDGVPLSATVLIRVNGLDLERAMGMRGVERVTAREGRLHPSIQLILSTSSSDQLSIVDERSCRYSRSGQRQVSGVHTEAAKFPTESAKFPTEAAKKRTEAAKMHTEAALRKFAKRNHNSDTMDFE